MLQKQSAGYYQSTFLQQVSHLVHGYSTRQWGDMKKDREARDSFLKALGLAADSLVLPEQIHGANVVLVDDSGGFMVHGADGIVSRSSTRALGVTTADCVPILAVDPAARIVAAVHAGWKGTLSHIAKKMVATMQAYGAVANRIFVSLGPRIGPCCYDVPEERARAFQERFRDDDRVVTFFEKAWHVDLAYATFRQLTQAGVDPNHIDALHVCTSCQINEFFSYRKDSMERFGEMMGVIGFKRLN